MIRGLKKNWPPLFVVVALATLVLFTLGGVAAQGPQVVVGRGLGSTSGPLGMTRAGLSIPTVAGLGLTTAYGDSGGYSQSDTGIGVNFADTISIGASIEGSLRGYPAVPFTYTAIFSTMPDGNMSVCMGPAASASGATEIVVVHSTGGTTTPGNTDIEDWSAPGTYSATVGGTQTNFIGGDHVYFRYQDDGTNITYSISEEGINWNTVYTVAKATDFLATNGGYHFFGVIISTDAGPGGTVMLGQQMTEP